MASFDKQQMSGSVSHLNAKKQTDIKIRLFYVDFTD